MANKRVIWLGNNVSKSLEDSATGKKVAVGEAISLTDTQIAALKRAGHRFADPGARNAGGGDEAQAAQSAPPPAVTPR